MNKRRVVNTWNSEGHARVTLEYDLTPVEQEVIDLAKQIQFENIGKRQPIAFGTLHALSTMPVLDDLFVRFVTDDVFCVIDGHLFGTLPEYDKVLDVFEGWWREPK